MRSLLLRIRLLHSSPCFSSFSSKGTEAAEHVKNNARSKRLAKKSGKLTQDEAQAKATKAKKASAFRNKVRERENDRERERERERERGVGATQMSSVHWGVWVYVIITLSYAFLHLAESSCNLTP